MAGQSPDFWSTRLWRLHYQPLLDPVCCALLSNVSFLSLHHKVLSLAITLHTAPGSAAVEALAHYQHYVAS